MDLLKAVEQEHSKAQCEKIVKYVGRNKDRFAVLMQLMLKGEPRVRQCAGWPLSICVEQHPELIEPYYKQLLPLMTKPGIHNAIPRNVTRSLQFVEIPKRYQGQVMNDCFALVAAHETLPAIKANALTILENLTVIYPEIKDELKLIIEERWPHEKAAFRSRASKILKKLK